MHVIKGVMRERERVYFLSLSSLFHIFYYFFFIYFLSKNHFLLILISTNFKKILQNPKQCHVSHRNKFIQ